ncbi:MAG: translation initiation factor IF-6 [Nitrososphaeria archaeon]|nr:translation initiation factor IF-6 [Aigarchaeota archaeon]MCX8187167.1 translation initiation factor IF-6 [Nitrososphaeria archaeon]MDW8021567.1 translation initiation factor IF-6 [Nitrososphaerota archaeon]
MSKTTTRPRGIYLETFLGTAEIGLFAVPTEEVCLIPPQLKSRQMKLITDVLGVEVIPTTLAGSILLSPMAVGNSNGILLSKMVLDEEVEAIKKKIRDLNIGILDCKYTAIGNLILANDRMALASSVLPKNASKDVGDVLGVEVLMGKLADRSYVGSLAVITNIGGVVYAEIPEEEEKWLSEIFKVDLIPATVNNGVKFVRSGIIANSKGAIIGSMTTGPELMAISRGLGV